MTQLLFISISYAVPLLLTALGGMFSERSGIVNIGLEGMMTFGAFVAALCVHQFELSVWVSLIVATLSTGVFALLFAFITVTLKSDQIIAGTALNAVALAAGLYIANILTGSTEIETKATRVPMIGEIHYTTIISVLILLAAWYYMFQTVKGLRLRSVGENPQAADSMGINVYRTQYKGVIISGLLAGLAGAIVVTSIVSKFDGLAINGRGFIALAILIFGRWHPLGILFASLFFAFTQTLGVVGSITTTHIGFIDHFLRSTPKEFFRMIPYIFTIIALIFSARGNYAPKAAGQPYDKGKR